MKKLQAFKFELMPTASQELNMAKFAGSCRFDFNKALDWQIKSYAKDKSTPMRYADWANMLPKWKREDQYSWLKKVPSQILQQALKDLEKSYKNFFNKTADFPKFKNRSNKASFRYPQGFKIDEGNARIFMPKLGFVRYRKSRNIIGNIKNITVSQKAGKWFVSIQTEDELKDPVHISKTSIGIDLGCIRFATLSDGIYVKPCNFKCHERRLKKYQRRMARKIKFSKNWQKEKCKVQKANLKISNIRNDFIHKTTTEIVKNNSFIAIEDLAVKKMTKSLAGAPATSGEKAKKRGLNRSILNQGWYEFSRQIEYKMKWSGGEFLKVPAYFTSTTCPDEKCGHISKDNRKSQALFKCVACGYENNADLVAAINIEARGHRVLSGEKLDFFACGGGRKRSSAVKPTSTPPMKQEPTETLEDIPL
jgi:putative transposase